MYISDLCDKIAISVEYLSEEKTRVSKLRSMIAAKRATKKGEEVEEISLSNRLKFLRFTVHDGGGRSDSVDNEIIIATEGGRGAEKGSATDLNVQDDEHKGRAAPMTESGYQH